MSLFKLTNSLRHDGEDYSAGDEIELDDAAAAEFRKREWLAEGDVKVTKSKPNRNRRQKPAASQTPANENQPTALEIDAEQVI